MTQPTPIATQPPAMLEALEKPRSEAFRLAMISSPEEMAYLTVELHRAVHDDVTLLNLLHRTVHVALKCIPGLDWCSVTVQVGAAPFTAASTGEHALTIDDQQYELDDGPCLRAMRSQTVVAMTHQELAETWPSLGVAADAAGARGFLAAPLSGPEKPQGALNLYSAAEGGFTVESLHFLTVLVEYVSRGMADYTALHAVEEQARHLKEAMVSRAPIEQAKGILMAAHQISAADAFDMLRLESQRSNTKLNQVAAAFVAAHSGSVLSSP